MSTLIKIVSLAFSVGFIFFAVVQYNDQDPFLWIGIYLIATILSIMSFLGRYNKPVLGLVVVASLIGTLVLFPYGHFEGVALKDGMKTIEIELARESLGLAIVTLAGVLYLFFSTKK